MADSEETKSRVQSVLDDPRALAVARVYSSAFIDAAASDGLEGAIEEFNSFITDVVEKNPDFESLLVTATLNRDDKLRLIDRVVAPSGSVVFTDFLRVLAKHDRLDLLPLICSEAQLEYESRSGKRRVQVKSAMPLTEATLQKIQQQLSKALPFEPVLVSIADPKILGGLVIQIGDTVYDSSLRTRLTQLRTKLRDRSLNEIQSGRDRFSHPEGD
jgi:F-type H+-transporting ATPase subunit delta